LTLPDLPPAASVSFSWDIQQTGAMTSNLELYYDDVDINGSENYKMWRTTAHLPSLVPNSSFSSSANSVSATGITNLNSSFGIGPRPASISISGTVWRRTALAFEMRWLL
jgi:hypothetical protein